MGHVGKPNWQTISGSAWDMSPQDKWYTFQKTSDTRFTDKWYRQVIHVSKKTSIVSSNWTAWGVLIPHYFIIIWWYPIPTNRIICSLLWKAPYKPSRTPLLVGQGYPEINKFGWYSSKHQKHQIMPRCFQIIPRCLKRTPFWIEASRVFGAVIEIQKKPKNSTSVPQVVAFCSSGIWIYFWVSVCFSGIFGEYLNSSSFSWEPQLGQKIVFFPLKTAMLPLDGSARKPSVVVVSVLWQGNVPLGHRPMSPCGSWGIKGAKCGGLGVGYLRWRPPQE